METMIILMSIVGLSWIWKESSILSRPRSFLMQHSSFMAGLLSCYFCIGFWSGIFIYLFNLLHWNILLWALAGCSISGLFSAIWDRLTYFHLPSEKENIGFDNKLKDD